METKYEPATSIEAVEDGEQVKFLPSGLKIETSEFWEAWHRLKNQHGQDTWKTEYTDKDRDYDLVQTSYLETHGLIQYANPFMDEDGFVDAMR